MSTATEFELRETLDSFRNLAERQITELNGLRDLIHFARCFELKGGVRYEKWGEEWYIMRCSLILSPDGDKWICSGAGMKFPTPMACNKYVDEVGLPA